MRCLMAYQTYPVLLLCRFMRKILFLLYRCVATPLNGFRKHGKCMTLKNKWYLTFNFCVWMVMIHTIITWTWLTSVINLGICTELTTGCISTIGGGIFSFWSMALSLSLFILFIKHSVNRARWIPWVIMSFGV